MKKNILFILILVVIAAWSFIPQVFSMGDRPLSKKTISTKQTPVISKIMGRVADLDFQKSTLTIFTDTGASLKITIDKNTSFSKGGKNLKSRDIIRKGDTITVRYETKRDINIAKSIDVHEKAIPASGLRKGKR